MTKWIIRIAIIGFVVGAGVFLWIEKPWSKGEDPVTFATVPVGKGTIAAQVTAAGTLSAHTTVQVGAQVNGRVIELHADFNDQVKKGQVLAKLDPSLYKAQLDQAEANYQAALANEKKAEASQMDADRQYKRQKSMQDQQLVAGATVESFELTFLTAKASVNAAKASVAQAAANLAQAQANLGYTTIVSPIDGVVLTRSYDVGQTVQSSFSAPTLFTIAEDLSRMQIDTAVAEGDVGRLSEGMKATFSVDAFPGKTFEGKVRQVRNSPTTTSGVVTYDAVIDVDNQDHALKPGMTANVTFVLASVENVVKIPNAALRFKPSREQMTALADQLGFKGRGGGSGMRGMGGGGGGSGSGGPRPDGMTGASGGGGKPADPDRKRVWKLVDGRPHPINIKIGLTDGSSTQLVEGELQPGDQLVTEIQGLKTDKRKMGAF